MRYRPVRVTSCPAMNEPSTVPPVIGIRRMPAWLAASPETSSKSSGTRMISAIITIDIVKAVRLPDGEDAIGEEAQRDHRLGRLALADDQPAEKHDADSYRHQVHRHGPSRRPIRPDRRRS